MAQWIKYLLNSKILSLFIQLGVIKNIGLTTPVSYTHLEPIPSDRMHQLTVSREMLREVPVLLEMHMSELSSS